MWTETVAPILKPDAVDERARDLAAAGLNGLKAVLVSFDAPAAPGEARLELHFHNGLHLPEILAGVGADPTQAAAVFAIRGGHRVRGGLAPGEVRTLSVAAGPVPEALVLVAGPVGDYSTYTLDCVFDPARIDPFFSEIGFKFRPGCFTGNCDPAWEAGPPRPDIPVIDYMAKDYDSFRHTLIAAMMERVPGWQPTSEADMDQVLIDLFAAAADELSDYQDRVMAEAYLTTARSRISLARHARLMDYHIHQGQQSSTWGQVTVATGTAPFTLDEDLIAWAGGEDTEGGSIVFATREERMDPDARTVLAPGFNRLDLHSWAGAEPGLPVGTISADVVPDPAEISAIDLANAINTGALTRLVLAEVLNPRTGHVAGRDPRKRQVLHLTPDAQLIHDPLLSVDLVRIRWQAADALTAAYAFETDCPGGTVTGVSAFFGNLVRLHHGLPVRVEFREPGTELPPDEGTEAYRHFRREVRYGEIRAVICDLPHLLQPLAYLPTPPGGTVAPKSTLHVTVTPAGGAANRWDEVISLVRSDDSAENGDHFMVETDERQESRLRFGDGEMGRLIPRDTVIEARYQVGGGSAGNVGADAIRGFLPLSGALAGAIEAITNPFDVTDGRDPEPTAEILRNVPEAYRARQLRAVTLADYIARAEAVPGVARAVASYAWTGSWRTVRLVVDPTGRLDLPPDLVAAVQAAIESQRLIGEDIEIRAPRFVPLTLEVTLCLLPHAWPEDLHAVLEQEFSAGYTPDGRMGFFHPDAWTFGQAIHRSQIAGRIDAIPGVSHIVAISMRRFDTATAGDPQAERIEMAFDEIALVLNDPDQMERGSITFDLKGGRQ
jgi:hypothetical protein